MARQTKPPRDPNGRHIRVYCSELESPAWRVLSWPARSLFIDLRSSLTGTNNGNLSATLGRMKHKGWNSSTTLANALFQLQALGFIAKTRGGGVIHGSKVCTLYRFTDLDVFEVPKLGIEHQKATHDFLKFDTVAKAEAALQAAEASRPKKSPAKKSTVQKMEHTGADNASTDEIDSASSKEGVVVSLHKIKQRKSA